MPFLRSRHDGTLVLSASSTIISRTASLVRPVRPSVALLGAFGVAAASSAWARPEKVVGVRAWTSGSQTYIRTRPSTSTPPVAKVNRHTPLYVWGKFNGWYRVETHDHIFGWVHNEYINSPDIHKVRELSHYKALLASKQSSEQTMYGTPAQLKAYYARYGGKGALKGLQLMGVSVAPKPKTRPVYVASRPAAAHPLQKRTPVVAPAKVAPVAPAPRTNSPVPLAEPPVDERVNTTPAQAPEANAASETPPSESPSRVSELSAGMLAKLPEAQAPQNLLSATPTVIAPPATSAVQRSAPVVIKPRLVAPQPVAAKPVGAKTVAKAPAKAQKTAAQKAYAAHLARAQAKAKKQQELAKKQQAAKAARIAKWKNDQAWKKKQHEQRLAAQKAKRQMRLASRAKQREQLGARAGLLPKGKPPVTLKAGQVAPLSPEALMKARATYLENRNRRWGTDEGTLAPVGSVSVIPNSTSPATPAPNGTLSPAQPGQIMHSAFHPGTLNLDGSVTAAPQGTPQPMLLGVASQSNALASRGSFMSNGRIILAGQTRGGSPRDRFAAGNAAGQKMATKALSYRGMPYIFGASSPRRGFDCSGLVYYLLRQRGYNPPRTAAGYRNYGQSVARGKWQPGDLILFANTYKRGISHIGVYLGNNKFVHAATAGRGVRVDSLNSGYYASKYWGARRVK